MDLPSILRDNTTWIKNHSAKSHYVCIFLRCLLGLSFLMFYNDRTWVAERSNWKLEVREKYVIMTLFVCIAVVISLRMWYVVFLKKLSTWKVYVRTILMLILAMLVLAFVEIETAKPVIGMLWIVDAMMGLQSRHTATLLI